MRFSLLQAVLWGLLLLSVFPASAGETEGVIGMMGIWDRAEPLVERASRESGIEVRVLEETDSLAGLRVLYVLNLAPEHVAGLAERIASADPAPVVIPLDERDGHAGLYRADVLRRDERVPAYWRANGLTNMRRLLEYTAITYLGKEGEAEAPMMIPDTGYYHPGLSSILPDVEAYRAARPEVASETPTVALMIQQSFWITGDTAVIDAVIRALEAEGFEVVTLFAETDAQRADMLRAVDPDLLVEQRHAATWDGRFDALMAELDAPYLRPISMLASTIAEWRENPQGLKHRDRSLFLTLQESQGTVEPMVVGGMVTNVQGFKLHEPIPDRVARFAARAKRWWTLRRKPASEKRVAVVYFNKYLGKSDLMRGSPTGAFLDGPASLAAFLPRMREAGYTLGEVPEDAEELIAWMKARGRNIGPWAQGELEEMADRPDSVLVPLTTYRKWFDRFLSEENREKVIAHFGEPPGRLMVVERNGSPHIVLPMIRTGNLVLAPQPARGAEQDEALLHSRDVPPPHNYLAFYWWLREEFNADAVVHWGTHGSLELLPGKEAGMSAEDWSDICIDELPVINPWIMDNIGEATLSRRRSYALLVDHLPPPSTRAGVTDELDLLHDDIHKFRELEPGALREEFRKTITGKVVEKGIDTTLGLDLSERGLTEGEVERVSAHIHEVAETTTPSTLHVLGRPPPEALLPSYLTSILGKAFLERFERVRSEARRSHPHGHSHGSVADHDHHGGPAEGMTEVLRHAHEGVESVRPDRSEAEAWVERVVLKGEAAESELEEDAAFAREMLAGLRQTDLEITRVLHALAGGFVPPGPGPDPIRNPASVPSGRNLYGLNPKEIPTRASWRVAVALVDDMLKGRRPAKVGFDLNGMNTMRDFGVVEGQILYLLGVRPVWNENQLAVDVEVIPREELGRPRIDVFVAMGGQYKENFPSRVELIDKAVRLAQRQKEADNGVRTGTERQRRALLARGFAEERADAFAPARVFGTKPGNLSGTNILHLIPRSGVWEDDAEVSSVYIDSMSYVYTGDVWGEQIDGLYEEAIQGTDTLIRVWASNMTSQLSNHHAYEYLGGLSMAVKRLTGKEPEALIADVRDPSGARMRGFTEVLAVNLRSELLNRKWVSGMMAHDYAGAGHMAELVKNTFGWSVTRNSSVGDWVWEEIDEVYIRDGFDLDVREWFRKHNPHARQEILATMLEAARKDYWDADPERVRQLARAYAESVTRDGLSAGLITGGNRKLSEDVAKRLRGVGEVELARRFEAKVKEAEGESVDSGRPKVRGKQLQKQPTPEPREHVQARKAAEHWPWLLGGVVGLLALAGYMRKVGGAR